jgi:prepilin-type N-terminal cleavage/methylation domain-containing protein
MHKKLTKRNEQTGFTIIEVVLVLAIAGLIFLIVFLALPALQRSRRDTQRKSEASRFISAAESYASNNGGQYPDETPAALFSFYVNYLKDWEDPSTGPYTGLSADNTPALGEFYYSKGEVCDGSGTTTGASNNIVVVMHQESGGAFCQDNQ